MELEIKNLNNFSLNERVTVSNTIFNCKFNSSLVHQVVSSFLFNARSGSKAQKSRSEVSGSNKKPWRQKGTGRARSGSIRSPIWRSGGVTFAAKPCYFNKKINKKMYKGALKSIFSKLVVDNRLIIVKDEFLTLEKPKTKLFLKKLDMLMSNDSVLIFTEKFNKNLFLASRNLHKFKVCRFISINPINLINYNLTIMTPIVIKKIEEILI